MKDRNISHSVATRLLNLARKGGESYEYILLRYGAERLLYRLCALCREDRAQEDGLVFCQIRSALNE